MAALELMERLRAVSTRGGRTYERGQPVGGRRGLLVAEIVRQGAWVHVSFRWAARATKKPPNVVLHVDDVRSMA